MDMNRARQGAAVAVDGLEIPRFGFSEVLRQGGRFSQVFEAADETQALEVVHQHSPALAMVTLRPGGGCSYELIERLARAGQNLRVLIVSAQDERLIAARVLNLGARGIVPLAIGAQALLAAVDRVLAGEYHVDPDLMQQLFRCGSGGPAADPVDTLSRREIDIFRLLGEGKTAKEIALDVHLSAKTVEYHRQRIKEKLHMASTADLIRYASTRMLESLADVSPASGVASRRRAAG